MPIRKTDRWYQHTQKRRCTKAVSLYSTQLFPTVLYIIRGQLNTAASQTSTKKMVAVSISDDLYSSVDKQITNMQKDTGR